MKKLVTLLLALTLVLTLVCSACAEDKPLKIMLSNAYFTAPYCAAYDPSAEATAKELDIPIIALSQLSRNAVQRTGGTGKPQLSDLRESGSIEQDADMVIFIHRPEFVGLSEDPADREKAIIMIAKHRNGEVCDIEMKYKAGQVRFVEPDQSLDAQAARPYVSAASEPAPAESPVPDAGGYEFDGNDTF